jgi:hypothetical protein
MHISFQQSLYVILVKIMNKRQSFFMTVFWSVLGLFF